MAREVGRKYGGSVPYTIFGTDLIDEKAKTQFYKALGMPGVIMGALMADGHYGYSLPIGGVVLTEDVVYPKWVGYDQGCGVCAVKTSFKLEDVRAKATLIQSNLKAIPVGFNKQDGKDISYAMAWNDQSKTAWMHGTLTTLALEQIGTLGGGNHFIEVCFDIHDEVWFVIHSGSRGVGYKTAEHYIKMAEDHGGYFEEHSRELDNFMMDLRCTTQFALTNREFMLADIDLAMCKSGLDGAIYWETMINKIHNTVEYNPYFVGYLHRKGATSAEEYELGVIPGNMSTGSVVVNGLGFIYSLNSAPHGAGRVSSRNEARKLCDLDEFEDTMSGITHGDLSKLKDENPKSYKDPEPVLKASLDCVEEVTRLWPIINVKG